MYLSSLPVSGSATTSPLCSNVATSSGELPEGMVVVVAAANGCCCYYYCCCYCLLLRCCCCCAAAAAAALLLLLLLLLQTRLMLRQPLYQHGLDAHCRQLGVW